MPLDNARVQVDSEFATLRTVVVSRSEVRAPKDLATIGHRPPVPDSAQAEVAAIAGHDFGEAFPREQLRWEAERDNLAAVLRKHGVEVLRPRLLTDAEKAAGATTGYANFFVRDPWFTIGDNVIEGVLQFPHRRNEVLTSRELLVEHVIPSAASYVALPTPAIPDPGTGAGPGPFLEGGDILVLGKHIFVGASGMATNAAGIEWLTKYLRPQGFIVTTVPLPAHVLHLDCAFGMVREGLLISCPDRLPQGLPAPLEDWDQIHVSETEAEAMATNGLPINPTTYILDPEFDRVAAALQFRGITVELIDFTISRTFGGAFRCSTQPLNRTD
ncbi:dimethylarginine dimethylaminohydrolase family protein [Nocardia sp. NPDC058058]|uniref:dimethylarginine dimethylaminohydrolase family protein n=1 Tax=Nocardia sp. NPDC058058 TaxID=3346317 RepID=UPI0036DD76A1